MERKRFINRDMLKYIAVIPMGIGHIVGFLYKDIPDGSKPFIAFFLSNFALFAPPIFFFFIAEGFHYTRSRKKYAQRLLLFAAINQIPFCLAWNMKLFTKEFFTCYNVYFILFLGLICLIIWESKLKLPLRIILVALVNAVSLLLSIEWMFFGIMLILGFHIFRDKPKQRCIWYMSFIGAHVAVGTIYNIIVEFSWWYMLSEVIMLSAMLLAYFLITNCYNGKKGKHPTFAKWFFYAFYPIHLWLGYILQLILK